MFRPLAFVAMRQQHHDAGEQSPLGFPSGDELIDDGLRDVYKITELSFPKNQSLGIVAAIAIFEAEHAGLGKRGIVNSAAGLAGRDVFQRNIFVFVLDIDENGMALVEGAAAGILAREANRNSSFHQARESEGFSHAVIHGTLACSHLRALLEELFYFGMNVEALGISR